MPTLRLDDAGWSLYPRAKHPVDLTLEQVKKAGRFAWHGGGPASNLMFVPTIGFVVLDIEADAFFTTCSECAHSLDLTAELENCVAIDWQDAFYPKGGWHHLPGCDCEFCRIRGFAVRTHIDNQASDGRGSR